MTAHKITPEIERVARAMRAKSREIGCLPPLSDDAPLAYDECLVAIAAIEALMLDPTPAMCEAFYRFACNSAEPDPNDFTPQVTKAIKHMGLRALGRE